MIYDTSNIGTIKKISDAVLDTVSDTGLHTKNIVDTVTLSGNAFTWTMYDTDYTAYKLVYIVQANAVQTLPHKILKYNNRELISHYDGSPILTGDESRYISMATMRLFISLHDTDTGWNELWNDLTSFTGMTWGGLIKAYMNGWKLTTANVNVASCVWTGIASGTVKNAGSTDYTYATTTIDTGFMPYRLYYQLATPIETQLNLMPKLSNSIVLASLPYDVIY